MSGSRLMAARIIHIDGMLVHLVHTGEQTLTKLTPDGGTGGNDIDQHLPHYGGTQQSVKQAPFPARTTENASNAGGMYQHQILKQRWIQTGCQDSMGTGQTTGDHRRGPPYHISQEIPLQTHVKVRAVSNIRAI